MEIIEWKFYTFIIRPKPGTVAKNTILDRSHPKA